MGPIFRFVFFNVLLPKLDVVTDLLNFLTLLPYHPRWAFLSLTWMFTSFLLHAAIFFYNKATGKSKPSTTWREFAWEFYKEAVMHLPFVATCYNILRAKWLYDLNYGTEDFKMRDSKKVEEILVEACKSSHGESTFEAGPQAVTQVCIHALLAKLYFLPIVSTFDYSW